MAKATKYIMYVDYKANTQCDIEWLEVEARDVLGAMREADQILNTKSDVYFSRILEKVDSSRSGGAVHTDYRAILCNRSSNGWHLNDADHGEVDWLITRSVKNGVSWISAI